MSNEQTSSAAITTGISLGAAGVGTLLISALTGFSVPLVGTVAIGAGIFVVNFTAFALCKAAAHEDERLGYK